MDDTFWLQPIIFMSLRSMNSGLDPGRGTTMALKAMKAGAVDFIEKPVGHQDLLASIRRALDQTRDTAALSKLRETAATSVASLTSRPHQILDLVLAGHQARTSPPISASASARLTTIVRQS